MYLCDGKVQAYIDDDSEEQNVEGPHHQQGLLQHQDLIEVIMDLKKGRKNTGIRRGIIQLWGPVWSDTLQQLSPDQVII